MLFLADRAEVVEEHRAQYMDVHAKTISVMGLRTRVLESEGASGNQSARGDAVVMIHGVGGWAENWREVIEPIARSGRRAIAVDLPGFGESEAPGRVPYFGPNNAYYPRFMLALMDALELSTAHLIGSSMGGAVAYMTAVTAPERIRSLTLAASGGLGTDTSLFPRVARLPPLIRLTKPSGRPRQGRDALRSCFFDSARIPATLYDESERFGFSSYPEFVRALRHGVSIRGVRRRLREHWVAQAARHGGPGLVVWGREDAVLPVSHLTESKAGFPQAE